MHGDGLRPLVDCPTRAEYVHVLFPDPWPSATTRSGEWSDGILREVSRILKCRGILRLVTDDPDYARAMEFHAASLAEFQCAIGDGRKYPPTEFQIKFLADSRPVYGLLLRRVS